jgi:hypothetical protein
MRRGLFVVAGVVFAFAALGASVAVAGAGGTSRPIKGSTSGTSVLDLSTGAFVQNLTGNESHLGKVTVHNIGAIVLTGPNSFTVTGTGVTTAANGDELFGTFSGSATIDAAGNVSGTTTITLSGGTGRFTSASGVETGSFSTPPGSITGNTLTSTISNALAGTISY